MKYRIVDGSLPAGVLYEFTMNGRTVMRNGTIPQGDVGNLIPGGTTSSYPSLKRGSTPADLMSDQLIMLARRMRTTSQVALRTALTLLEASLHRRP